MIVKARDPHHPPYGRIDGVIYYGGVAVSLPIRPVGFDLAGQGLSYWDDTAAGWLSAPVADSQLSADVVIAPLGVLPTLDGSNLEKVLSSADVAVGAATLDGAGVFDIGLLGLPYSPANAFAFPQGAPSAGQLWFDIANNHIASAAGGGDAGLVISYLLSRF